MNPHGIFSAYNISNKYSFVMRLRLESDPKRADYFFRIAYSSSKPGLFIRFSPTNNAEYPTKYVQAFRWRKNANGTISTNTADGATFNEHWLPKVKTNSLWAPTNTWFDMSVVVGEGRLRIGLAVPNAASANHQTINFGETDMITEGSILGPDAYMLFEQNYKGSSAVPADANWYTNRVFRGSVQQIAIWDRMLSDDEVREAFGMPRPTIFRVGLDNGTSGEFGGTRSGATQTIDGLGLWRDAWNTMAPGDTWTVNFEAMRDEAGLPQIFSIHTLPESATADISVSLNGTSLRSRTVYAQSRVFWPIPENKIVSGANTLTIHRNRGSGDFLLDSMELGGSFGVGAIDNSNSGLSSPARLTGGTSTASPSLQHWPNNLLTYTTKTNNMSFWVDPDLRDRISFDFTTSVRCFDRSATQIRTGNETFKLFVNGEEKWLFDQSQWINNAYTTKTISFAPGELNPGWNTMRFATEDTDTCYWAFDYYRMKATLPRGFSIPPVGLCIIFR